MKFLLLLALAFVGCSEKKVVKKDKPNYDRLWNLRDRIIQGESTKRIDIFEDSSDNNRRYGRWLSYDSANNLKRLVEKFDYPKYSEAYTAFFNNDSLFCLEYDNIDTSGFMRASTVYFFENGDTVVYPVEKANITLPDPVANLQQKKLLYTKYKKRS